MPEIAVKHIFKDIESKRSLPESQALRIETVQILISLPIKFRVMQDVSN
jgi:hypothetical protein